MEEKTNFFEKFWYLFVVVAIILLAVVGGLWFYNQKALQENSSQSTPQIQEMITGETEAPIEDAQIAALQQQSDSDEISQIETDIQATDLSNIDKELADIEAEIASP